MVVVSDRVRPIQARPGKAEFYQKFLCPDAGIQNIGYVQILWRLSVKPCRELPAIE
jgi:hypothetical protein